MSPPTSNLDQSIIYSDNKAPTDPNKVSHVMIINVAITTIFFFITCRDSLQEVL